MTAPDHRPTLADQRAAISVLADLAEQHPNLPGGYFVQNSHIPNQVDVQLNGLACIEAWRAALGVPTDSIRIGTLAGDLELSFRTVVGEVAVYVYATGVMPAGIEAEALAGSAVNR